MEGLVHQLQKLSACVEKGVQHREPGRKRHGSGLRHHKAAQGLAAASTLLLAG